MSTTVKQIVEYLTELAPIETAESWDNCGLLIGGEQAVTAVMVALDITPCVVKQAKAAGANLIVSHHPVIFRPVSRILANDVPYMLAQNGMSACCLHTCLDKAIGGVNEALAERLGLNDIVVAADGFTRVGTLAQPMEHDVFIDFVENSLHEKVRFHGNRTVSVVAVVGGSGGEFLMPTLNGKNGTVAPDAFVTGELRHNVWLEVADCDQVVVEAGHFSTEHPVVDTLIDNIRSRFPSVNVIKADETAPYSVR